MLEPRATTARSPVPAIAPRAAFDKVPPLRPGCRATVVIPAQNEAEYIARTLRELVDQRDLDGSPLDPSTFDILVYANSCTDATAAIVRDIADAHPRHAIFVVEEELRPEVAHIGTARGAVMDAAAARFFACDREDGAILSTDADTLPSPTWLAWNLRELRAADAVMGRILFDRDEWTQLPDHTRRTLRDESAYYFTVARLEAQFAPKPYDPWPRHWQNWGPSFAVRASAYASAGGVPRVRVLEDIALYRALERSGARIRHSLRVRVTTSARLDPRAIGGFGTRIGEWNALDGDALQLMVEHPADTLERLRGIGGGKPTRLRPQMRAAEATALLRRAMKSR
jgi:glycosyltransferase involved in cell wall biosynthesis